MIRAILTDIEGTTTSISFVFDVLFPYARAHIAAYVRANAERPEVRAELEAVTREAGRPLNDEEAIAQLIAWIDADRKVTPLKALQGMLWERGYLDGAFTGHIYADAARCLREWKAQGLDLYVYSSGSVKAQHLIFGHSDFGDLRPLFSSYFDTRIGHKREPVAYEAIAREIGRPAGEVLFLSDIVEELDAARAAGMQTCHLVRDGALSPDATHPQARGFDEIQVG